MQIQIDHGEGKKGNRVAGADRVSKGHQSGTRKGVGKTAPLHLSKRDKSHSAGKGLKNIACGIENA